MRTTLFLIRHGQTVWNVENRFRGRANIPLDEVGLAQAQATAAYIATQGTPTAVYASPLRRARQMAEAIAEPFMLHERAHPGFLDLHFGAWEGRTETEVRERWQLALRTWYAEPQNAPIPGGEQLSMAQWRAMGALREVVNRHPDEMVVIVGHATLNRLILLGIFDIGLKHFWHLAQDIGAINCLEYDGQAFTLLRMNDTYHLRPGGKEPERGGGDG